MAKSIKWAVGALAGAAIAFGAGAQSASYAPKNDTISKAAAVYGTYQGSVGDVRGKNFSSANDIDRALTELGGHNSGQLSKGWLSYSALVASQNREFRAALNDAVSAYGRDRLLLGLKNDYGYARRLKGGTSAVGSALTALDADARRIRGAADRVKEQAYTLQSSGWAKAKIGNAGAKANSLLATSRSGRPASSNMITALSGSNADNSFAQAGGSGAPSLWDGVSSAASTIRFPSITSRSGSYKRVRSGQEQTANRIATLAAYRVVGTSRSADSAILTAMSDQAASGCLNTANLNLQQCVAAAHKQYEVPFCIGQHALAEIGECIGKVAQ